MLELEKQPGGLLLTERETAAITDTDYQSSINSDFL